MLFVIGFILIVKIFLLSVYYYLKANNDDLNRPSFFNSKVRKYSLLLAIILLLLVGEYLIYITGFYEYMWLIPLICFILYHFAREEWSTNLIVSRIFKYYKIFKNPVVSLNNSEQLIAPIDFLMIEGKFNKKYMEKAKFYLEKRIKEGKFKTVRDLPREAWALIGSVNKEEIDEDLYKRLSQSKIDYFYEEIIEGKTHNNFKTALLNMFWVIEVHFEKLFKNFAFFSYSRPDFTEEEIQLVSATITDPKTKKKEGEELIAVFTNVGVEMTQKFGWVSDFNEYSALAALEFSRRYPEHKFSKKIKKQHKFSDEQIFEYAQNWARIDVSKIKVY